MNVFSPKAELSDLHLSRDAAYIGFRPEHLELRASGQGHADAIVKVKEQLGGESLLYLATHAGQEIIAKVSGEDQTAVGDTVSIFIPANRLHQFNDAGHAI